jgi:hypothetical protein
MGKQKAAWEARVRSAMQILQNYFPSSRVVGRLVEVEVVDSTSMREEEEGVDTIMAFSDWFFFGFLELMRTEYVSWRSHTVCIRPDGVDRREDPSMVC